MSKDELAMIEACLKGSTKLINLATVYPDDPIEHDIQVSAADFIAALDARGYRVVHK